MVSLSNHRFRGNDEKGKFGLFTKPSILGKSGVWNMFFVDLIFALIIALLLAAATIPMPRRNPPSNWSTRKKEEPNGGPQERRWAFFSG
jgi:hypothetical protein